MLSYRRLFKLLYTYRSDWSTDNELVYIQQNKWALHCPFCEAHCYCLVLDIFVLIRSICISVVQSFSLKIVLEMWKSLGPFTCWDKNLLLKQSTLIYEVMKYLPKDWIMRDMHFRLR